MVIDSPESLHQFQNGEIAEDQDRVSIYTGAHPDILSLPKHFANYTNSSEILFMAFSPQLSFVSIYPNRKEILAVFNNRSNVIRSLPNTFEIYKVRLSNTIVSVDDMEYLLQWKSVKVLWLNDSGTDDFANILCQRIMDARFNTQVEELNLNVQNKSYLNWNIETYLKQMPNIRLIRLSMVRLNKEQMIEFLERQNIPIDWTFTFDGNANDIKYYKQASDWRMKLKQASNHLLNEANAIYMA